MHEPHFKEAYTGTWQKHLSDAAHLIFVPKLCATSIVTSSVTVFWYTVVYMQF